LNASHLSEVDNQISLILKMLDSLSLFPNLSHCINAYLQVDVSPSLSHHKVRLFGFDAFGGEGHIRDQQQGTTSDDIVVADNKDRRGFHVDADAGHFLELFQKRLVVFPDTSIGRVNHARSVIVTELEDFLGNEFV